MEPASNQDLLTIFERIDTDHSGSIEIGELRSALLRKGLTPDECAKMFAQLDANKDGKITRSEFLGRVNTISQKTRIVFAWYLAFEKYDKNGDGVLSLDEFEEVLRAHSTNLSRGETERFFADVDANGDKRIDYKEFVGWTTGQNLSTMSDKP